jgi:hypothetical protein
VQDEGAAGLFPQMAVLAAVVDQHVAGMAMLPLQRRAGGDHRHAGEVALGPPALLRLGPVPAGKARQDYRVLGPNRVIEFIGVGQGIEALEKAIGPGQAAPELAGAVALFKDVRRGAQYGLGRLVEVGQNAVAVEVDLPPPPPLSTGPLNSPGTPGRGRGPPA